MKWPTSKHTELCTLLGYPWFPIRYHVIEGLAIPYTGFDNWQNFSSFCFCSESHSCLKPPCISLPTFSRWTMQWSLHRQEPPSTTCWATPKSWWWSYGPCSWTNGSLSVSSSWSCSAWVSLKWYQMVIEEDLRECTVKRSKVFGVAKLEREKWLLRAGRMEWALLLKSVNLPIIKIYRGGRCWG